MPAPRRSVAAGFFGCLVRMRRILQLRCGVARIPFLLDIPFQIPNIRPCPPLENAGGISCGACTAPGSRAMNGASIAKTTRSTVMAITSIARRPRSMKGFAIFIVATARRRSDRAMITPRYGNNDCRGDRATRPSRSDRIGSRGSRPRRGRTAGRLAEYRRIIGDAKLRSSQAVSDSLPGKVLRRGDFSSA